MAKEFKEMAKTVVTTAGANIIQDGLRPESKAGSPARKKLPLIWGKIRAGKLEAIKQSWVASRRGSNILREIPDRLELVDAPRFPLLPKGYSPKIIGIGDGSPLELGDEKAIADDNFLSPICRKIAQAIISYIRERNQLNHGKEKHGPTNQLFSYLWCWLKSLSHARYDHDAQSADVRMQIDFIDKLLDLPGFKKPTKTDKQKRTDTLIEVRADLETTVLKSKELYPLHQTIREKLNKLRIACDRQLNSLLQVVRLIMSTTTDNRANVDFLTGFTGKKADMPSQRASHNALKGNHLGEILLFLREQVLVATNHRLSGTVSNDNHSKLLANIVSDSPHEAFSPVLTDHELRANRKRSGVFQPLYDEPRVSEAFIDLLNLTLQLAHLTQLASRSYVLSGRGGEILMCGVLRRQIELLIKSHEHITERIKKQLELIVAHATYFNNEANTVRLSADTWQANFKISLIEYSNFQDASIRAAASHTEIGDRLKKFKDTVRMLYQEIAVFTHDLQHLSMQVLGPGVTSLEEWAELSIDLTRFTPLSHSPSRPLLEDGVTHYPGAGAGAGAAGGSDASFSSPSLTTVPGSALVSGRTGPSPEDFETTKAIALRAAEERRALKLANDPATKRSEEWFKKLGKKVDSNYAKFKGKPIGTACSTFIWSRDEQQEMVDILLSIKELLEAREGKPGIPIPTTSQAIARLNALIDKKLPTFLGRTAGSVRWVKPFMKEWCADLIAVGEQPDKSAEVKAHEHAKRQAEDRAKKSEVETKKAKEEADAYKKRASQEKAAREEANAKATAEKRRAELLATECDTLSSTVSTLNGQVTTLQEELSSTELLLRDCQALNARLCVHLEKGNDQTIQNTSGATSHP